MATISKMMRTRRRREDDAGLGIDGGSSIDFSRCADFSSVGRMGAITVDSLRLSQCVLLSPLESKVSSGDDEVYFYIVELYNFVN